MTDVPTLLVAGVDGRPPDSTANFAAPEACRGDLFDGGDLFDDGRLRRVQGWARRIDGLDATAGMDKNGVSSIGG
jgi:hypothetical protein